MKEIFHDVDRWFAEGETAIALATVVNTWGSAPRKVGAKMAFTADGRISGSVSGGCVEGAVLDAGLDSIRSGEPQLLHYGVADETAWEVGLACGGIIDVFVEILDEPSYFQLRKLIVEDWEGSVITVISGPKELVGQTVAYSRDGDRIGSQVVGEGDILRNRLPGFHRSQRFSLSDDVEVFVDIFRPAPTLIMVGGVHVAIALTILAKTIGYRSVIVDPRRAFGSEIRFPNVDKLVQEWPKKAFQEIPLTADTAVALLTHDPKIDDQALSILLDSSVFYIGALGSRKTHNKRLQRLEMMGYENEQLARIHAPIGLRIGADNPEEIALAVLAEIVAVRRGVFQPSI